MTLKKSRIVVIFLVLVVAHGSFAKGRRTRRYSGSPPTHPVVLWARTLSESPDLEAKKVAAFKLSQYSQTIFQVETVNSVIACTKHADFQLKVLCTKALIRCGNSSQKDLVRNTLIEIFDAEPRLRSSVIRAMTARNESSPVVLEKFLAFARETKDPDLLISLLGFFESTPAESANIIPTLSELYSKSASDKIRRSAAKALASRAAGSDVALDILARCAASKDGTPLILICLDGLEQHGKNDPRTWLAAEKAIELNDPDVQLAVVDLIISLTPNPNPKVVKRLLSLLEDVDDDDLLEKIVLSLGVVGDGTDRIAESLHKLLESQETFEGARIAAALTIAHLPNSTERSHELLNKCTTIEKSETLRSACQLGMGEMNSARSVALPKKNY